MKMSLRIDRLDIGKENGPSAISWALEKKSTIAINKKKMENNTQSQSVEYYKESPQQL